MKQEVTAEMLRYAADVCGKYREVRTLGTEAETAWKQSLALMEEAKYSGEREMYEREAAEELEAYTAARSWLKLVNATVSKVRGKSKASFEAELHGRGDHEGCCGGQKVGNLYEPIYRNPV